MLPNLIILGAMKAGTTALFRYLAMHPAVFGCKPKEPMYFSSRARVSCGLAWYESLFAGHGGEPVRLEASTTYTKHADSGIVAQRIFDTLPDVKLIYMVRSPIARMRSHHEHMVNRGVRKNLSEALEDSDEYVIPGCYFSRLASYVELFPSSQIHVISFDDFTAAPKEILRDICRYVDIDPAPVDAFVRLKRQNGSREKLKSRVHQVGEGILDFARGGPGVSEARKVAILNRFEAEQASLEKYLGRKMESWKLEEEFDALFSDRSVGTAWSGSPR